MEDLSNISSRQEIPLPRATLSLTRRLRFLSRWLIVLLTEGIPASAVHFCLVLPSEGQYDGPEPVRSKKN